jgi:YD repeat-containing protein
MYWGDQNNNNYLNYYDSTFMGFTQTTVDKPDGSVEVHKFYAGEGWGIYDTNPNEVKCYTSAPCHKDPWWDLANAAHGHEYQTLYYDTDGTTLLKEVDTTYTATCPPTGVAPTPPNGSITWDGQLISDLDHNNPVAVCDIHQTQQVTKTYDGASSPVTTTTNWTYDNYGRVTQDTTTSNGGTPSTVVKNTSYVWNDNVTATKTSASGTYIIDTPAFTDTEDGSGNRLACSYTSYDGQGYTTGQTSNLTGGLATTKTSYANCGTSANGYTTSGPSTTTKKYDAFGNVIGSDDADANAGISGHTGCTVSSTQYTNCTTYDSTFDIFPTASANALNQTNSTSYGNTSALFGYGTWPQSTTDANNQTTSYTYDSLNRITGEALPGEISGDLTKQWVYTNWCSSTSAQAPCVEIDEIDRLNSSTTTTTRAFYDGEGRLVETRAPGPVGQDVVTYVYYDTAGRQIFKSNPYFVTAFTGVPGAAAYSIPDSTQPGTTTTYTNLRTTSVTDPNSHTTATTKSVICSVSGTSDTGCYEQSMVVDANGHESATLVGGLGKTNYTQTYTGISGSYTLYATTTYTYDAAGNLLSTKSPDGSMTSAVYDGLGHATSKSDPDRGTTTYTYDPNGNITESVDARESVGTVYTGYDGLNRPLWSNSTNSSSGAWVSYSYDSTANGNDGIGRVTSESFTGTDGLSGSYAYTYDGRGQQTGETVTVNGANYPIQTTYDDAGVITSTGRQKSLRG